MSYDSNAINEALAENMADDPYGTITFIIVEVLKAGATYNGGMSEIEYQTLVKIATTLDDSDYHREAVKAMQAELP